MPTLHLHDIPRLAGRGRAEVVLSARESALLAWLHLEGPTPRARLAGLLWPGGTEAQARANLRQTLARLKRAAGALLDEADGVLRLAAGLRVAEPDDASAPLLGTLAFDDTPEFADWLAARREAALRRHQRETLAAARRALDGGELDAALAAADAVLATHPETEEAWRLRMEAFHRRGDRAAALQAWDDCRHALRAAFGVAPAAETQALGRRLLDDTATPAPVLPQRPGGLPAALRRPPQLLGRGALLATLRSALALGQAAVVLGPGGIGKSRLLAELAQQAGPALLVGARPGDGPRPGALVARLVDQALRRFDPALDDTTRADLARLLPPVPGQAPPADLRSALEHRRVLGAVTRLLQACHAAGMRLVAVDDLQFADDTSLEALQTLVGAWRDTAPDTCAPPLLAARGDELGAAGTALLDLLAGSGRALRHELAPLGREQVRALLDDVLPAPAAAAAGDAPDVIDVSDAPDGQGAAANPAPDRDALAAALHAQVGGNPAFLVEALKGLWQAGLLAAPAAPAASPSPAAPRWRPGQALPLPPTLLEAVRLRLQRLSPEALQLAQLAAVAQADFSVALAAGLFNRSPLALAPVLAELAAAQVMEGASFAHDLVADAVRRSLPPALPAALHALVAERLQALGAAPAAIAQHLQAAGQARAAVPWLLQAAAQARARWQMSAAAAAYEAAARALTAPGSGAVTSVALAPGPGAVTVATPTLDEADRRAALRAWRDAARCRQWAAQHDAVGLALAAAEPLARGPAEHALLHVVRTGWLFGRHRFVDAVQAAGALMDALDRVDRAEGEAAPLAAIDHAYAVRALASAVPYGADMARALHHAARAEAALDGAASHPLTALDGAAADPDPSARPGPGGTGPRAGELDEARLVLHTARAGLLHWNAQPLPALVDLDRAEALALRSDDEGARLMVLNQRMRVRHAVGDLDGAGRDAAAMWQLTRRLEVGAMQRADVLHVRGMVAVAAGRPAEAAALLAAMAQVLQAAGLALTVTLRTSLALALMNLGRLAAAAEALGPPPAGTGPGSDLLVLAWHLTRARLARRLGEPAQAHLDVAAAIPALPPGLHLQREVALVALAEPGGAVRTGAQVGAAAARSSDPAAAQADSDGLAALHARVRALGLRGMGRTVALGWARAALAAGRHDEALHAVQQALDAADAVDAWLDEPATTWLTAAEVLAALGRHGEADAVAAQGRAWVLARAEGWGRPGLPDDTRAGTHADTRDDLAIDTHPDPWADAAAARQAWLHGHPLHRRLLAWPGG